MKEKHSMSKIYDTMLSMPGMNEPVKLHLALSRKQIFFLHKVIDFGLTSSVNRDDIVFPEDVPAQLQSIANDLLNRAGLAEMNEKLKGL